MTILKTLKEQQTEIREISGALLGLMTIEQQTIATIAKVSHTLLCDLCKKLDTHLANEHKGVFPELLSHGDKKVQSMVWGFINNDKIRECGFIRSRLNLCGNSAIKIF